MNEKPKIAETARQDTATIHLTIPKDAIQREMGPGISEVMAVVAAQGITPSGAWFTHHLTMSPDGWDFEISVPVPSPVEPSGRVQAGEWRAMKVVRTVYHGPYEGMGDAWGEFDAWIAANGLSPAEDLYECYLAGPESGEDSSTWRTQLNRPLAGYDALC